MLQDPHLPQAKPGVHYRVLESPTSAYLTFPDEPATAQVRHTWVLVRRAHPCVPKPSGTPLLKRFMSAEDKGRLLSVYLRPWVLHRRRATAKVPHVADLIILVTHAFQRRRRVFGKTVTTNSISYPRSFADAWEDYRKQHVVSKNALRLIRNFLLTQMAESAELDDDDEAGQGPTKWEPPDTSFATLEEVHRFLHGDTEPPGDTKKADQRGLQAHIAGMRKLTQKLWGHQSEHSSSVAQDGSLAARFGVASEEKNSKKQSRQQTGAALFYNGLTRAKAEAWLPDLCSPPPRQYLSLRAGQGRAHS